MKTNHRDASAASREEIQDLALLLWKQAGCPVGRNRVFWEQAEEQIDSKRKAGLKSKSPGKKT
jgi:hypothetical protein